MRRRRGDIYPARIKAAIGAAVVVIMCLIIWGPLMLFVSGLSTENTSIVSDVSVSLSVHGSRLFFQNDVDSTRNLTGDDIGRLSKAPYNLDMSRAGHFLFGQQLNVAGNSSLVWNASPWVRQQLAEKGRLPIDVSFGFTRAGDNVDTVFAAHERVLDDVEISFPLFFAMRPDGTVSIVDDAYADCQLALLRDSATGSDWWTLTTVGVNGGLPQVESRPGILLYALADVVLWQSISGGLSTTTIITLTIVLAIGRSIRSMLPRVDRIVYEEVPDVAAVKELCCDVFQARFDGDHVLEEDPTTFANDECHHVAIRRPAQT